MAGRKRFQLDWVDDSDDEDSIPVPRMVRIPHTEVNLGDSGGQSTESSYLSGPASPSKKTRSSTTSQQYYHEGFLTHPVGGVEDVPNHLPDLTNNNENDDDLDPAYKYHLAELDNGDDAKAKQRWPRVSTISI